MGGQWLIALAARVSRADGVRSRIVVFSTTDALFQSGYAFVHNLYVNGNGISSSDSGGADVTVQTLERPECVLPRAVRSKLEAGSGRL